MFRPLPAILRVNTQYMKKLLLLQRIRCVLYQSYCVCFGKCCSGLLKFDYEVSTREFSHLFFNIKMLIKHAQQDSEPQNVNSVAWIRERTIPTERRPLVGEVSANFCG
jgi:hypothetical protein